VVPSRHCFFHYTATSYVYALSLHDASSDLIQDLGPVIEGVQVWGPVTNQDFRKTFLDWYDKESRRLPWRESKDPYRIWVSEIMRSEEHTSELQSRFDLVCRLLLEKKKKLT